MGGVAFALGLEGKGFCASPVGQLNGGEGIAVRGPSQAKAGRQGRTTGPAGSTVGCVKVTHK